MRDWTESFLAWYDHCWSYVRDIMDDLTMIQRRALSDWQVSSATTEAATSEDVGRPKEKPRPPCGGSMVVSTTNRN